MAQGPHKGQPGSVPEVSELAIPKAKRGRPPAASFRTAEQQEAVDQALMAVFDAHENLRSWARRRLPGMEPDKDTSLRREVWAAMYAARLLGATWKEIGEVSEITLSCVTRFFTRWQPGTPGYMEGTPKPQDPDPS